MRIIEFSVHPDYYEDGDSNDKFKKGSDIALALCEIPKEKYSELTKE